MGPPPPPPGQRERVDDRAGPRLQVEVVESAQNALAMGDRGRRVTAARRRLAGHRVGCPGPGRGGTGPGRIPWTAPAAGLDGDLAPPAEVPALAPARLLPRHPR